MIHNLLLLHIKQIMVIVSDHFLKMDTLDYTYALDM